jgi:uncharacterized membrane protein
VKRILRRRAPGESLDDAARADWPYAVKSSPDVLLGGVLALVGAWAFLILPAGSTVRIALVAPVLVLVPGYLLIQTLIVPASPPGRRAVHAVVAIGASPALVALAALATAIVPGGFRPGPIVAVVTLMTLGLAAAALYRRAAHAATADQGSPGDAPLAPHGESTASARPEAPREEASV